MKKIAKSELYQILIRTVSAYIICLLFVIGFTREVHESYISRLKMRQPLLLEASRQRADFRFEEKELLMTQAQKDIEGIRSDDAESAYKEVLERTRETGKFEMVLFLTGTRVYTDQKSGTTYKYEREIAKIKDAGFEKVSVVSNLLKDGDLFMIFPKEVTKRNGEKGYIVGLYNCSVMMDTGIFKELNEEGAIYLMENNGTILFAGSNPSVDVNAVSSDNFYTHMYNFCKSDVSSRNRVLKARENAETRNVQSVKIKAINSHQCYITIAKLQFLEGYSVAVVTDFHKYEKTFGELTGKIVRLSLLVGAISVLSLLLLWRYFKKVVNKMDTYAYSDGVTGGKNLNYFREKAQVLLEENQELPYIIQRFDIVNFRYLNEAYGHIRADEVLKECIRVYEEMSSERELCVRMDSDQFVSLTINDRDLEEKRNEYTKRISDYASEIGIKYPIRFKIGIYQFKKQDHDIDVMIDNADAARRSLKGKENEFIAYYSDAIIRDKRKVDKIESEMQHALDTEEFKVFVQAKWDIVEDKVAGAEALVRWSKPDGSMVFPDEFIPVFEKNAFIGKLDFYMLEKVLSFMRQVLDEGGTIYPVSVNQSRVLLHNPEYLQRVQELFDKYQIPREYVELEVTETALFDDKERMVSILDSLKKDGIRLAMDDFGSGYSSLNTLKDLPFDILKIDKEFFSEAITSDSSTLILRKIIEMADGLGMEVICEGVENEQQVNLLKDIGCRRVQGYYYARPVAADKFIRNYCMVPGEKQHAAH